MHHIRQKLIAIAEHHHNIEYIDVGDPSVLDLYIDRRVSADGIGVTRRDAHRVTTFADWFTHLPDDAYINAREFRNVRVIDTRGTQQSVTF